MVSITLLDFCVFISLLAVSVVHAKPDAMAKPGPDADAKADPVLKIIQHIIHRQRQSPYQKCEKDSDCKKNNNYCIDKHCKCLNSYKMNEDHSCTLIGGPGSSCKTDADCKAQDSSCNNGRCECKKGMKTDGSHCFTPADYNQPCKKVIQCTNQVYYACTSGKCLCAANAVMVPGIGCKPKISLGGDCKYDRQCSAKIPNSECKNGKCVCIKDFQLNKAKDACVPAFLKTTNKIQTTDPWNANYLNPAHGDSVAYTNTWNVILSKVDGVITVMSMTFEDVGGKTKVTAMLKVANPDKASSRRRRSVDEPEESVDEGQPQSESAMEEKSAEGQSQADKEDKLAEGQPQAAKEEKSAEGQPQAPKEEKPEEEESILVKTLKEREVKEMSSPIMVSAPDILMSGDVNPMENFCLQNIDCPSHVCDKFACM